jgi:predicted Fe-S protein YdhL (DUF1289 family)
MIPQTSAIEFDPRSDAGPVPSPCIRICRFNAVTGWCEGCFRRLEEIGRWPGMSEEDKRLVWQRVLARRNSEKT